MNIHHITKSLFVGAAIAGIGMSSGRADVPLSGETRAWNVAVKKLEPLFEKAGVGFNSDKLRFLISQTCMKKGVYFSDQFVTSSNVWLSMQEVLAHRYRYAFPHEAWNDYISSSKGFLRCISSKDSLCIPQKPTYIAPVPFLFKLEKDEKGSCSNEEARKYVDFIEKNLTDEALQYVGNSTGKLEWKGLREGGFKYLKKHPEDIKSKFRLLPIKRNYFVKISLIPAQVLNDYVKQLLAFRFYYMLTGLYFDTNFETQIYKGVGDGSFEEGFQFVLVERKLGRNTYVRGVRYERSKNANAKSLESKIERLCDLKERLKNMKVWFEEYAKSSSEVKDFALVKNMAFANLRKKLTFTNVCAPESLPEQSLQFTKDAQGKIEVKVLAEAFKQENIDSIEIEILRNLDAVEKMIEFYSLECVWIVPPQLLVFSTRRYVNQGSNERFVFPRKYPFDSSLF